MGIDLVKRGRIRNSNKKNTRSTNLYVHLLIKLFRFMARRTDSKVWAVVLRRLISSRVNRPPLSLSKLIKHHVKDQFKTETAVIVATVTDDERLLELPKGLKVAAGGAAAKQPLSSTHQVHRGCPRAHHQGRRLLHDS